jgi:hypothetical protein
MTPVEFVDAMSERADDLVREFARLTGVVAQLDEEAE